MGSRKEHGCKKRELAREAAVCMRPGGQPAGLEGDRRQVVVDQKRGEVADDTGVSPRAPRHVRCYCFRPMISNLAAHQNHPRKF